MKSNIRSLCILVSLASTSAAVQAENLIDIYRQALGNDPIVLQAKAQRDRQYAAIDESKASLLPNISAEVGFDNTWINNSGTVGGSSTTVRESQTVGGVSLDQTIFDYGAFVALDLSEKVASQADAIYAQTMQELIVRVSNAYFGVLTAQDSYDFQKAETHAFDRQLEQTKQRFAVGLTAITDVHEAQAQFDLARAAEIQAENALQNSYEELREITGRGYQHIDPLDTERFSPNSPLPERPSDWVNIAKQSSVELLSQKLNKDIAQESIKLAKTGHLPTISFNALISRGFPVGPDNGTGTLATDQTISNVGINMRIPIFEGFRVSSQVEQAQFQYVEASQQLEQVYRRIVKDVRNNYNNVSASISSISAYEQSVLSAKSALDATQAGFEVGTRTIVDVLNRTSDLFDAKRQLSDARYNYIYSILALKQASGTLSEQDVQDINDGLQTAS